MSHPDTSPGSADAGPTQSVADYASPLWGRFIRTASAFQRELWFIVVAAMLVDVTLTVHGLHLGLHERNPVARAALDAGGVLGLYGLKTGALAIGAGLWLVLPRSHSVVVPLGLALPTTIAVVNNTLLILYVLA